MFTAIVGMFLSVPGWPGLEPLIYGTLGIGMASSSAAVFNHVLDHRTDILMMRTRGRPLPQGKLTVRAALAFATVLCVIAMLILWFLVNPLTATLTFFSLIGYAVIYTVWLKRATPQNIVIGGAAGAAPPVLGWTTVTNEVTSGALLLFLIVFVWTPPHFWALAIARLEEYAKVDIPMLPVTHGVPYTRLNILLYSILLLALRMYRDHEDEELPMRMFKYSIAYLGYLFAALLIDHYFLFQLNIL
jgi:protoheme IX farnesyltransferase